MQRLIQLVQRRNLLIILLGLLFSVGAIVFLFSQVDFDEFTRHLREADRQYIALMVIPYGVSVLLRAVRWHVLLREPLNYWRGFHIINVSFMMNAVLPLRLGELARVILMRREPGQSAGAALSALTLERLLDVIFALLSVGLGLVLLPEDAAIPPDVTSRLGVLIVLALVAGVLLLFLPRTHPYLIKIVEFLTRPLPDKLAGKLVHFATDTLHGLQAIAQPRRLLASLFWSAALWGVYLIYYQLGLAAFINGGAPVGVGLLTLGMIALGGAAPSLPGAVGVFQAAAVIGLTAAGYDADVATSYAWGVWVPQIILVLLTGILSLWVMGLSFGKLAQDVQAAQQEQAATD